MSHPVIQMFDEKSAVLALRIRVKVDISAVLYWFEQAGEL